ncbi:hypothetical protein B0J12DRAFT_678494, partial [Macrophomina phaseolina]
MEVMMRVRHRETQALPGCKVWTGNAATMPNLTAGKRPQDGKSGSESGSSDRWRGWADLWMVSVPAGSKRTGIREIEVPCLGASEDGKGNIGSERSPSGEQKGSMNAVGGEGGLERRYPRRRGCRRQRPGSTWKRTWRPEAASVARGRWVSQQEAMLREAWRSLDCQIAGDGLDVCNPGTTSIRHPAATNSESRADHRASFGFAVDGGVS